MQARACGSARKLWEQTWVYAVKCFARIANRKSPRTFQKCRWLLMISSSSLNVIAFPLAIVCIILPFRVIFLSVSGGQWKAFSEAVLHASVVLYENIHSVVYLRRKQMFLTCQKCKNALSWWTASISSYRYYSPVRVSKERKSIYKQQRTPEFSNMLLQTEVTASLCTLLLIQLQVEQVATPIILNPINWTPGQKYSFFLFLFF